MAKTIINLAQVAWTVAGYMPQAYRLRFSSELNMRILPEVPAIPVNVPGSVQGALRQAGLIPDWNQGLRARECEWVENRDWVFTARFDAPSLAAGQRASLIFDCLDGPGYLVFNGHEIGPFANAFARQRFDVTDHLRPTDNVVHVVFTPPPRWLGQVGHTSRITVMKPRFNYGWDWAPRLVQIGIAHGARLEIAEPILDHLQVRGDWDTLTNQAIVTWRFDLAAAAPPRCLTLRLLDSTGQALFTSQDSHGQARLSHVEPWWPSGMGGQPLYRVVVSAQEATDQDPVWEGWIGFRRLRWRHADAATPADPWVLEVNGQSVFVQGVNWTPVRLNFADVSPALIEERIETYRELGMNMLRVWGGATVEHPGFYDACDRLGLLVWQDLPLSSSGIENWPPEDDATIERFAHLADDWMDRLGHHACLALWCGGNELQGSLDGRKTGVGRPVDASHPLIRRVKDLFERRDPTRRFVVASSSGPRFTADADDFGQNLHWDVHGPWRKPADDYWMNDDALFRSEVGMPGASPAELIRRHSDGLPVMPPNEQSLLWARTSWWIQWDDYLQAHDGVAPRSLEQFVDWSQKEQAAVLVQAVEACRNRFPHCGGIILWMGHDCFPCTANTSILDFDGRPKPAAHAVALAIRASCRVS